jgi:hypothetical protein
LRVVSARNRLAVTLCWAIDTRGRLIAGSREHPFN